MKHHHLPPSETQEVYLRLEKYEDLFSDFDIRPFSRRSLSADFLDEIKRATYDKKEGGVDLILHIPAGIRSEAHEITVKERLAAHFKKHYLLSKTEKRKVLRSGFLMTIFGVLFMTIATIILFKGHDESLILSVVLMFLEPAAWFLLWEGMDQIIFNSKHLDPELNFYKKMADTRGHVHFKVY